jgi:hypothetical protein
MTILYEPELYTAGQYEPEIPTAGHYEYKNGASLRGHYGQNQNGVHFEQ